jgi:uncharacterized membrane protein
MEINRTDKTLEIIVPVKQYWQHIFVFGIATIIMIPLFILVFIKRVISLDFKIPDELYGLILFTPIFANYSLWLLKGKETLIFDKENVTYIKTNGIIKLSKIFEKKNINNLKPIEKTFKSDSFLDTQREKIRELQRAFPFWIRMGKIVFVYKGNSKTVFNGLSNAKMIEVSKIINEELQ